MSEAEEDDKEHEPSQRRLDQAREKGQIARSPDLTAAASIAGFVLTAAVFGSWSLRRMGEAAMVMLDQAERLSGAILSGGAATTPPLLLPFLAALLPFLLVPAFVVLGLLIAQRSLLFTPENLMPRLSRIDPFGNARQKFGRRGLFEFAKSSAKLCIVATVLIAFLIQSSDRLIGTLSLAPGMAMTVMLDLVMDFLLLNLAIAGVMGGADYLWQWFEHRRRNRMSRKEMMDEHRESEGDPHAKAHRRQRGQEIALNRMLADVPKADVIIVNPTHYAVALQWTRGSGRAPVCLAKGVDEIAARIRERAAEAGVPIHRDPPIARALHATVDLGQEIRPEHYRAVAAAIRFAEAMRRKVRGQP
jgi:flagellar biosynthetic protein FlhB